MLCYLFLSGGFRIWSSFPKFVRPRVNPAIIFSRSHSQVCQQPSFLPLGQQESICCAQPDPLSMLWSCGCSGSSAWQGASWQGVLGEVKCAWYVSVECHGPHSSECTNACHNPGARTLEAPGQQFLQDPGKLVGDDLHPLGLHYAKYNLMNSPNSLLFYLASPWGSTQKQTNTQILWQFPYLILLMNGFYTRPTHMSDSLGQCQGWENLPDYYTPIDSCTFQKFQHWLKH